MANSIIFKLRANKFGRLSILFSVAIVITIFTFHFSKRELKIGSRITENTTEHAIVNSTSTAAANERTMPINDLANLALNQCRNCNLNESRNNNASQSLSESSTARNPTCVRKQTAEIKCVHHPQWENYEQHSIDIQAYENISFGYQKKYSFAKGSAPIYTYSAFYDPRFDSGPVVLINAFNLDRRAPSSKCLFFLDSAKSPRVTISNSSNNTIKSDLVFLGDSITSSEHYHCTPPLLGLEVGSVKSCIIVCPFPNTPLMPSHIALDDVSANTYLIEGYSKSSAMQVIFPDGVFDFESKENFKPKYDIVLCGAILYFDYDAVRLVEWFELAQITAAEHVFLCTIQSAPNVNKILKYYILQGFLDVVEWDTIVPTGSVGHFQTLVPACEIHCSQLYQYQSKFIAHYDLDQFIIPRIWGNTFPEFLRNYEVEHERKYGSPFGEIVFRNRYLFTNLQKALAEECEPKYLVTQRFRYKWSSDYNLDQIKTIIRSPWCILKYQHGCTSSFEKYRYTSNCSIGQGSNNKESKCSRNEAISRMSKLFNSSAILLDHELGGVLHYKGCHWRPYQNCILAEEKGVYDDSMELYRNCLIANVHDAIARMQLVAVTFPTLG